jgi:type II secretory pathway pseudopilin PulG
MPLAIPYRRYRRKREQGYLLLVLMLVIAVVLIMLSARLPGIVGELRHDREDEMIHRGVQYARAIRLYYKKNNAWPSSIAQLKETNHRHYLRQVYKDPITGGGFRLLHASDLTAGGIQLSSGGTAATTTAATTGLTASPSSTSSASVTTTSSTGTSGASSSSTDTSGAGSATGASGSSGDTQSGTSGTSGSATSSASSSSTTSGGGLFGALTGGMTSSSTTAGSSGTGSTSGLGGQVFGGGPIVGVASQSPKKGFHIYYHKDVYKEWMFIYDLTAEGKGQIKGPYNGPQTTGTGTIPGATPAGQIGLSSSSSTTGSSTSSSSSSSSSSSTTTH